MDDEFSEKQFFLEAFQGTILTFTLEGEGGVRGVDLDHLHGVVTTLIRAGVRCWLLIRKVPELEEEVARRFGPLPAWNGDDRSLSLLWRGNAPLTLTGLDPDRGASFRRQVVELTTRWRVQRLVVTDPGGGVRDHRGRILGFVNSHNLDLLAREQPGILEHVAALLAGGVAEVSLCRPEEVGAELFTYQGAGTFFAHHHYCRVRPLTLNDFRQVADLIRRGEREGYLLPRDDARLLEVLNAGYGAFVAGNQMAGVCALLREPYRDDRAAEVAAIYTLTRFQGEGVGVQLVRALRQEARQLGLAYLFACTHSPRVMDFFRRNGFRPVEQDRIPVAKWRSYEQKRRAEVVCLRCDL
ncbi:MAG: GNAT family N-acetyltransferase [Magnetococcales bacterium]|nr:GNAT family N-acetyltransferase [Magnetococcales bacterium]